MDDKEKTSGTAVFPESPDGAQHLLDRLTEAATRLQERDARQQAQRLEDLQRQTEAASQELESARLRTARGREAQQALQQQLRQLLLSRQSSMLSSSQPAQPSSASSRL